MLQTVAVGLLTLGLIAPGAAAGAKDGDVIRRGSCSGASTWKLKAGPEAGRIQVEFEVDSNVVGQRWDVRLSRNGVAFFNGTRTTTAPSGSFEVRRSAANPAGTDAIRGRALNAATGELCVGRLDFAV
jgi:hypothetical protein